MSDDTQIDTPPTPNTNSNPEAIVDPQVLVNEALATTTTSTPPTPTSPVVPEQIEAPVEAKATEEELPLVFVPKMEKPITQPEQAAVVPTPSVVEPVKPKKKGKSGKKVLMMIVGFLLMAGAVAAGGWYYYSNYAKTPEIAVVTGTCSGDYSCTNSTTGETKSYTCSRFETESQCNAGGTGGMGAYCTSGWELSGDCSWGSVTTNDDCDGRTVNYACRNKPAEWTSSCVDPNNSGTYYKYTCITDGGGACHWGNFNYTACSSTKTPTPSGGGGGEVTACVRDPSKTNSCYKPTTQSNYCVATNYTFGCGMECCATNLATVCCCTGCYPEGTDCSLHACTSPSPSPRLSPSPSPRLSPSPSPRLSPSPSPSPSPSSVLTCNSLVKDLTDDEIEIGSEVTFTCSGSIFPASSTSISYDYRIKIDNGGWENLTTKTNKTATYAVEEAGSYTAQCRACAQILGAEVCNPIWSGATQ